MATVDNHETAVLKLHPPRGKCNAFTEMQPSQKAFDKLEFGGESPLTMRARCSTFRYCPDPLGIVPAEQFDKLEFCSITTA